MKVTAAENRMLWALRGMVGQHCDTHSNDSQVFDSGFIRANRDAMEILVEYGHMELVSDNGGRWYEARMVEDGKTPNAFGQDVEGGSTTPVEAMGKALDTVMSDVEHFFDESPLQKKLREEGKPR